MSTRCNIIVKDEYDTLWFYRHSDGYPSGTLPTLRKFMRWVKEGKIRDNVGQSAGWLVVIGHEEYLRKEASPFAPGDEKSGYGWKVGAYEPTAGQHGDIEYLYTLDLTKPNEIRCQKIYGGGEEIFSVDSDDVGSDE